MGLEERIENILNHHIALGIDSIYATMVRAADPQRIRFNHLFNRVMVAIQAPVTFVLFKKDFNTGHFRPVYFPVKTKKISIKIERLANYIEKTEEKEKALKYLFPVWDNSASCQYYLLVLREFSKKNYKILRRIKSISEIKGIWDIASYKLEKIFTSTEYQSYSEKFAEYLLNAVKKRAETEVETSDTDKIKKINNAEKLEEKVFEKYQLKLLSNITQYTLTGHGVIDSVFDKISKNMYAVVAPGQDYEDLENRGFISNFFLFSRDYHYDGDTREYTRQNRFNYNVRVLICSRQERQILKNLEWMSHPENKEKRKKVYQNQLRNCKPSYKKIALQASDKFMKLITSEGGRKEIINILKAPFGKTSRSMADYVFESSVSLYRAPFSENAGLARVFEQNTLPIDFSHIICEEQRRDTLRVVICQYLFESMAGPYEPENKESDEDDLWAMLNPIEIGGRIWAVTAFSTRSKSPDFCFSKSEPENIRALENYNRSWTRNYFAYRTANERMKRNLRSYMNRFYYQFVADLYAEWAIDIYNRSEKMEAIFLDLETKKIQKKLESLSRIFSYQALQVEIKENEDKQNPFPNDSARHRAYFSANFIAELFRIPNPVFPTDETLKESVLEDFVNLSEVAIQATDTLLRQLAEDLAVRLSNQKIHESPNQEIEGKSKISDIKKH